MMQGHRRAHVVIWAVLVPVLLVVFVLALGYRPVEPEITTLPALPMEPRDE
jgi:hypothetical protein